MQMLNIVSPPFLNFSKLKYNILGTQNIKNDALFVCNGPDPQRIGHNAKHQRLCSRNIYRLCIVSRKGICANDLQAQKRPKNAAT